MLHAEIWNKRDWKRHNSAWMSVWSFSLSHVGVAELSLAFTEAATAGTSIAARAVDKTRAKRPSVSTVDVIDKHAKVAPITLTPSGLAVNGSTTLWESMVQKS
jgi:hypothetical protein